VLAGAIDSYYGDFKAYPGPISEANLIGTSSTAGNDPNRCTSSQNLVWGLEGGWEPFNSNSYSPHFSSATVGTGAMSFNNAANTSPGSTSASQTPRYRPYLDGTYLLPQPWKTPSGADPYGTAVAADSLGLFPPVFVDRYPARGQFPAPILYLRAHVGVVSAGGSGVSSGQANYRICTTDDDTPAQYDNAQLAAYKSLYPELANCTSHGKPAKNNVTGKQDYATWDAFFADPGSVNLQGGAIPTNLPAGSNIPTARHADTYLLISPGVYGQFGTVDNIFN
jgi:hypothetical protein